MLKVEAGKNLDKALKSLKYKVIKTKQNEKLRANQEFVKKSVKKREQKLKAQYVQQLKDKDNN
jgi:small subunit ribosomal protein S21